MKPIRMFLLTFQRVIEQRGRIFVWFLVSLINPLLLLLFWRGISAGHQSVITGWTVSTITSYYLLLTMADSFLTSHIEEDISREDILKGDLSIYLMRPFPYFLMKFIQELPYRLFQGIFAVCAGFILYLFFGSFTISSTWYVLIFAVCLAITGFMISFTFKMILGLIALWIKEPDGIYQFFIIVNLVVGGYVVPLYLMPSWLSFIAYFLPFSYVIYFPVIAFQGKLTVIEMFFTFAGQLIWLLLFVGLYKLILKNALKKFTAIGI
ncbi:MAG TPA: ABC-2 family transporter protein [Candidatus Eisenbacteria bacterium]|nr:ABC-2 family transporter protein [Candidatus Eisenbacteria bacterium]